MNKLVYHFLKDYLKWCKKGCRPNKHFRIDAGLCHNFTTWSMARTKGKNIPELGKKVGDAYYSLIMMFIADGLDRDYPFNRHYRHYEDECRWHRVQKNKQRMAWVRSKV